MTTLRSTLIQAVEALEMGHHLHPRQDLNGAVLAALRAQIEALDKAEPVGEVVYRQDTTQYGMLYTHQSAGTKLYAHPQPTKAEPVAAFCGYKDGAAMVRPLDNKTVLPIGLALYAHPQPTIPDGWQLVPKEHTDAMHQALVKHMRLYLSFEECYQAMLAAAPEVPK